MAQELPPFTMFVTIPDFEHILAGVCIVQGSRFEKGACMSVDGFYVVEAGEGELVW